ncbi:unnamed protein product, partial [Pelagomonas calceolata]
APHTPSVSRDQRTSASRARLRRVLHLDEDLAHARRVARRGDRVGLQIDQTDDALPRVRRLVVRRHLLHFHLFLLPIGLHAALEGRLALGLELRECCFCLGLVFRHQSGLVVPPLIHGRIEGRHLLLIKTDAHVCGRGHGAVLDGGVHEVHGAATGRRGRCYGTVGWWLGVARHTRMRSSTGCEAATTPQLLGSLGASTGPGMRRWKFNNH